MQRKQVEEMARQQMYSRARCAVGVFAVAALFTAQAFIFREIDSDAKTSPQPTRRVSTGQLHRPESPPRSAAASSEVARQQRTPEQHKGSGVVARAAEKQTSSEQPPRRSSGRVRKRRVSKRDVFKSQEKASNCPLIQRYPFDAHSTANGEMYVYLSPQGRALRREPLRRSWWCAPWLDRGCGYSHAYTRQPPNDTDYVVSHTYWPNHKTEVLPHMRGGIPAAFDDWKSMVVGPDEGNPSSAMLKTFQAHSNSFTSPDNQLVGHFNATVKQGDPTTGCARVIPAAVFVPLYVWSWAEHNLAHFIGDVWHFLFQLFDLYRSKGDGSSLPMVFFPQNSTSRLATFALEKGLPDVVMEAVPGLVASGKLGEGRTCVKELIVDCPVPNILSRYDRFQAHLMKHRGWSFTPRMRTDSDTGHGQMLLLMRRVGGSRVLLNPQEVVDTAQSEGWCVRVLRSDVTHMSVITQVLQNSDALAAVHGAELAFMIFMRNASVVIEAVPRMYSEYDGFYVEQARAGGLSLLRWYMPKTSLVYWGRHARCKHPKVAHCLCLLPWSSRESSVWPLFRHRGTRGLVSFHLEGWRQVAQMAREVMPWEAESSVCPRTAPNVFNITGVPDVQQNQMRMYTHGALCDGKLNYPCQYCG
eukprot:TRINITY_DN10044_c0_g2_i1.p1 TRINITY_DN10044_c0_g2~~TRINITY_DN10044_c0_g2_i1.p1  ORF type:complete len:640 (+),score=88.99 TRINITY_DN10044_c0_g2_i1:121-2040(+)